MKPAAASTPSDTQVAVTRSFDASVDLVWNSFTKPERVKRWMLGPPGWTMPVCEMDFRVGGKYQWRWRNDEEGNEFGFVGEFREIETPTKIVHTENYQPGNVGGSMGNETIVTLSFQETGGVTTVVTSIQYSSTEDRDAALASGMTDGMEMGYKRLDEILTIPGVDV